MHGGRRTVGPDLDPQLDRIVVVFNATPTTQDPAVDGAGDLLLSPIQEAGSDDVVKDTGVDGDSIEVPARTVAVLVQRQS